MRPARPGGSDDAVQQLPQVWSRQHGAHHPLRRYPHLAVCALRLAHEVPVTWYYEPSTFAPGTGALSLPSATPESLPEPCVTLSGMPTRRPLSWHGWKRRDWIRLLSGTMSRHSTASLGVESWISSLRDSHVSPSPLPGRSSVLTTSDGSGPTSAGLSLRWDRDSCSWKTSQGLFEQVLDEFWVTLPTSGSMRSGVCSPRPPLEHPTSVNDSGAWATPAAREGGRSPESYAEARESIGRTTITSLSVQAKASARVWATPTAKDAARSGNTKDSTWNGTLTDQGVRNWPTPKAHDAKPPRPVDDLKRESPDLSDFVRRSTWPSAPDGGPSLRQVADISGRLDPTTKPAGDSTVVLNPRFVEGLMGLPSGWLTPSILGATDSSLSVPPPHSTSCLTDSSSDATTTTSSPTSTAFGGE